MKTAKETIIEQMTENTGKHALDSGGENGRLWQRNQGKDLEAEPEYTVETDTDNEETIVMVSTFHYLNERLKTDEFTEMVNGIIEKNDLHWVQEIAEELQEMGYDVDENNTVNTYNHSAPVTQDFLYIPFEINNDVYILLQTHNGADIRGGYSQTKAYKLSEFAEGFGAVFIDVETKDGEYYELSKGYFNEALEIETVSIL